VSVPMIIPLIAAVFLAAVLLLPGGRKALSRLLRQSSFVAGAIVLTIGALTLNTSTQWLKLHFKKQSAPLRVRGLADQTEGIPSQLGAWMQVTTDQPIDPEMEAALKTREYINRVYVNTAAIGNADADLLRSESDIDREKHLGRLRNTSPPQAFMTVMITFNTGLVDTVTHIPENCFVASGYQPSSWEVKHATCGTLANGSPRNVDYRFITFEDQTGQGQLGVHVGYLFQVDGEYESSPYGVRTRLQNLFERYGYYAKVEMMVTEPQRDSPQSSTDSDAATVDAMNNLLTALLPELERCLPDWKQLHQH
jgi:hypothetical protein